jgi:hypothetical protein
VDWSYGGEKENKYTIGKEKHEGLYIICVNFPKWTWTECNTANIKNNLVSDILNLKHRNDVSGYLFFCSNSQNSREFGVRYNPAASEQALAIRRLEDSKIRRLNKSFNLGILQFSNLKRQGEFDGAGIGLTTCCKNLSNQINLIGGKYE